MQSLQQVRETSTKSEEQRTSCIAWASVFMLPENDIEKRDPGALQPNDCKNGTTEGWILIVAPA